MQLLRVGNRLLNIDQVCEIWLDHQAPRVTLFYIVTREEALRGITFSGDDAIALMEWLHANSTNLTHALASERPGATLIS
jgi:hypothetical protein